MQARPLAADLVPRAGLEPARSFEQRILSPQRLPIPPPGRDVGKMEARFATYFGSYPHLARPRIYDQSTGFEGYHRKVVRASVSICGNKSKRRLRQCQQNAGWLPAEAVREREMTNQNAGNQNETNKTSTRDQNLLYFKNLP